jgi:flagellar basal-body rod protein FlgC
MNLGSTFAISASGLQAQRLRMDLIAANLANANSTASPDGGPYRRQDVVLEALRPGASFSDFLSGQGTGAAVRVRGIVDDPSDPRSIYDPGHPHADETGHVSMPNVNVMSEMVDLMAATRAYEANIAALDATRRVLQAALEIGQG